MISIYLTTANINLKQDLENHNVILLLASTGLGKTTLLLDTLKDTPTLYLVNRQALDYDISNRINRIKSANITVQTYQSLEYMQATEIEEYLSCFDVIVCDEAHYWTSDCNFNNSVFLSFEAVMTCSAKKILTTASGQALFGLLADSKYRYVGTNWGYTEIQKELDPDPISNYPYDYPNDNPYESIINAKKGKYTAVIETDSYLQKLGITGMKVYCFISQYRTDVAFHLVSRETFEKELLQIPPDKKAVLFTDKVNKTGNNSRRGLIGYGELLKDNNKSRSMLCSSANRKIYVANKMEEVRNNLLDNEQFNSQYLLATTTIDNGININDTTITSVFCDFSNIDPVTVQQCIGRVRLPNETLLEPFHVFIVEKDYRDLQIMRGNHNKWFTDKNKYLSNHKTQALEQKFYSSNAFRKYFHIKNGAVEFDYLKSAAMNYEMKCLRYHSHYDAIRRQLSISTKMISSELEHNRTVEKANMFTTLEEIVTQNFLTECNTFPRHTMTEPEKELIVKFAQNISSERESKKPKQIEKISSTFSDKKIPLKVSKADKRKKNIHFWDIQYASGISFFEKDSVDGDGEYQWLDYKYNFDSDSSAWIPVSEIEQLVAKERERYRKHGYFTKKIVFNNLNEEEIL